MKEYRVDYAEVVGEDLAKIFESVAEISGSLVSAERTVRKIVDKCQSLRRCPMRTPVKRTTQGREYRTLRAGKYSFIYCVEEDAVEIVKIYHNRMNLSRIFERLGE